jgi:hypothetical protein
MLGVLVWMIDGAAKACLLDWARAASISRVGVSMDQRGEVVDQIDVLVPVAIGDAHPLPFS